MFFTKKIVVKSGLVKTCDYLVHPVSITNSESTKDLRKPELFLRFFFQMVSNCCVCKVNRSIGYFLSNLISIKNLIDSEFRIGCFYVMNKASVFLEFSRIFKFSMQNVRKVFHNLVYFCPLLSTLVEF